MYLKDLQLCLPALYDKLTKVVYAIFDIDASNGRKIQKCREKTTLKVGTEMNGIGCFEKKTFTKAITEWGV